MKAFAKYLSVAFLALAAAAFSGCRSYKDIKVTTCEVERISPSGLRAVDVQLRVGVDNPILGFRVSDIEGRLLYDGEEMATYVVDPLDIRPRCLDKYEVHAHGTLSDGVSPVRLLVLARNADLSRLTTDVKARVTIRPGVHKTLKFNGLPVHQMID